MKKSLTVLAAFILSVSMFAGCGFAELTGEIDGGYVAFTAKDGWFVDLIEGDEGEQQYTLKHPTLERPADVFNPYVMIRPLFGTPKALADHDASFDGRELLDDVTIGDVTYHVVQISTERLELYTHLDSDFLDHTANVVMFGYSIEQVKPVLETIVWKMIMK